MHLEVKRRIRDNLHGSIDISPLEDLVIEHPLFQRMRRVRQTSFLSYVFPGATHTRFEHSLGVMHLAGITWEKLRNNQARLKSNIAKYPRWESRETADQSPHGMILPTLRIADGIFGSPYVLQCLRIAALLHDVGHPPFSHSGERFLPSIQEFITKNPEMSSYLREYLMTRFASILAAKTPKMVDHEIYTLLMVDRIIGDTRSENRKQVPFQVSSRDVLSIIKPEIKPEAGSPLLQFDLYQLCHELVSGELDVDRMDYLLRDSRECGVIYGIFDSSRILDSLAMYLDPADQSLHVAIQLSGLSAFEDYLRARQSMYLQLYFHKTSVAAEAMLKALAIDLGDYRLPAALNDYAAIDEYNIYDIFSRAIAKESCVDKEGARKTLDNLLLKRNLWKRAFEVSGQKNAPELDLALTKAMKCLEGLGIRCERISTSVDLTRFSPRGKGDSSKNYLRLIKKDAQQFPRVRPIEDECTFISRAESMTITRIYIDPGRDGEILAKAKVALLENV